LCIDLHNELFVVGELLDSGVLELHVVQVESFGSGFELLNLPVVGMLLRSSVGGQYGKVVESILVVEESVREVELEIVKFGFELTNAIVGGIQLSSAVGDTLP
jgi:hypothetical protein